MSTINGPGPAGDDVVLVRWPAESARALELARAGALRLLLVEPGADPPIVEDDGADWIRLPADPRDVAARVVGLGRRRTDAAERPEVDAAGRLLYGQEWVALSPIEARIAAALVSQFRSLVPATELIGRAWPSGDGDDSPVSANALRVHLTRLRKRVEPLGLVVRSVRSQGFVLEARRAGRPR